VRANEVTDYIKRFDFGECPLERLPTVLSAALQELANSDGLLLRVPASERSICHRLAIYLERFQNTINPSGSEWFADCEYNLRYDQRKRMHFPISEPSCSQRHDCRCAKKVIFPDIILHRRETTYNEMAIETKILTNITEDDIKKDLQRLVEFQRNENYNYNYVAFILFGLSSEPGYKVFTPLN